MLTSNLKQLIDEKWDNCWPVSNLRPIAILDLTGYIYFLKKSDDLDLISKKVSCLKSSHFILSKEIEEFTWSEFKDMDAQAIHDLFARQFGILDLMNEYGQSDFLYSRFFRTPLMLKPTSRLLLNVIEIVNLIESCDTATQCEIIEYLLDKAQTTQNDPQFIPQYISTLMVSISEPRADDVIYDISTGNGSLLIGAVDYIENNHRDSKQALSKRLKGLESNPSLLRIAGMRMMLHGMNEPDVELLNATQVILTQKPTLFISYLLPAENADHTFAEGKAPDEQMEIILLNNILKNLEAGSRAIALVSENLLKSFLPEIESTRKELVDNTNLEGVIHLSPRSKSYSAAGILIFNKQESETTSEVWFCKMDKPKKKRTVNETIINPNQNEILLSEELAEAKVLLDQWKKRKEITKQNCFFINVYDIKNNNYNLNFNYYKLISSGVQIDNAVAKNDEVQADGKAIVATKKDGLQHFYAGPPPLKKRKRKRKMAAPLLLILILVITAGWSYLYYFKDNKKMTSYGMTDLDSVKTISNLPVQTSKIPPGIKREKTKKKADTKNISHAVNNVEHLQNGSKRYTVVNKTYFHSAPDSSKRKSFYLQPRQNLVLIPTEEENGFVYVVYINKKGESTHGWLAKKDLEPVD
ncbi:MAG: HsdM family class I SAM-dependent methyltransferase [Ginsengibacter sp.]